MRNLLGKLLYYGTFKKVSAVKGAWGVVIFHKDRPVSVLSTRKGMRSIVGDSDTWSRLLKWGGRYLP